MKRAVLIGDSQAAGLAAPLKAALLDRGVAIVGTAAHSGQQTIWFARERIVAEQIARHQPQLVIFALGGNDAQRSYDAWVPGVKEVIRQAAGLPVVWIGTAFSTSADVQERHLRVARWQQTLLPQLGARWIDSMPLTLTGHIADGVHFTRQGYESWAALVAKKITSNHTGWWLGLGAVLAGVALFARYGYNAKRWRV